MCDVCNIKPVWYKEFQDYLPEDKTIQDGSITQPIIGIGVKSSGEYYLFAVGADLSTSENFYIDYCPKCGRKLI